MNIKKNFDSKQFLMASIVPILFIIISIIMVPFSKYSGGYLANQIVTRLARNMFLVISLIIPIIAGMGINFGMTLGAMAGQIALTFVDEWCLVAKFTESFASLGPMAAKSSKLLTVIIAMLISAPISYIFGRFAGAILNRAKGREMITSMILGYFFSGLYQFFMLYVCGGIIPFTKNKLLLPRGFGIRNSFSLDVAQGIDKFIWIKLGPINIPVLTFLIIIAGCLFIIWIKTTKLGQDMRAVGQNQDVSSASGIDSDKIRTTSIVISTVLAGIGQIIYLQNIGNLIVYNGADQAGLFAAAAILVGGASVSSAGILNALIGTAIFHLLFIIMPVAGKNITGNAALGEYMRMFVSYGVVTLALVIHAWKRAKENSLDKKLLDENTADKSKA